MNVSRQNLPQVISTGTTNALRNPKIVQERKSAESPDPALLFWRDGVESERSVTSRVWGLLIRPGASEKM